MAKAKQAELIETASQKYRRVNDEGFEAFLARSFENLEGVELSAFTSPSGMEWQMRRPSVEALTAAGSLPMGLASKLAVQANGTPQQMTPLEQAQCIEFTSKVIRYCCVSPRLVETPTADNELGFDDLTMSDYQALAEFSVRGGNEAEGLNTFRSK